MDSKVAVLALALILSGCAVTQVKERIVYRPVRSIHKLTDQEKILKSFESDRCIILAFQKAGIDMFAIAKYMQEYEKETKQVTFDGFCAFLKKKFTHIAGWTLDAFFADVKMNYELIQRYEKP